MSLPAPTVDSIVNHLQDQQGFKKVTVLKQRFWQRCCGAKLVEITAIKDGQEGRFLFCSKCDHWKAA